MTQSDSKGNQGDNQRIRADLENRGVVVGLVGLREMAAPPIPIPIRVTITILSAAAAAAREDCGAPVAPQYAPPEQRTGTGSSSGDEMEMGAVSSQR